MVNMQPLEPLRYSHRYEVLGVGWFTALVDSENLCFIVLHGRATVAGAKALIASFNEMASMREGDETVDVLMDLSGLTKTPLRAQALLGKWLVANRRLVGRVAIFGAKSWENRVSKAVFRLARFEATGMFRTRDEASRWLRP